MSIYEIDAKVKELKELRDMEAEVKSSIAAIEDSLKAEMLAKNTDVLSGKDYLITWKTIITNRFDSAAFKLTHADLFNQFSRSTTNLFADDRPGVEYEIKLTDGKTTSGSQSNSFSTGQSDSNGYDLYEQFQQDFNSGNYTIGDPGAHYSGEEVRDYRSYDMKKRMSAFLPIMQKS